MSTSKRLPKREPGYWQSLNELEGSEEFAARLGQEFPDQADQAPDGLSRRSMLQWMSASAALAGLTGCRWPEEEIIPFDRRPESYQPGQMERYASTVRVAGRTRPVLVTSFDGRPIKIEGNPDHPLSLGAADALTQANLLELYDQDRTRQPMLRQGGLAKKVGWAEFESAAQKWAMEVPGERRAVLSHPIDSPTLESAAGRYLDRYPGTSWYSFDAGGGPVDAASSHDLEKARILIDFDADLLVAHPEALRNARAFAKGRRPNPASMNRLYVIEPIPSATGAAADHRVPLTTSAVPAALAGLAALLKDSGQLAHPEFLAGLDSAEARQRVEALHAPGLMETLTAAAGDLLAHQGEGVVALGSRYAPAAHHLIQRIHSALGSEQGPIRSRTARPASLDTGDLATLVQRMEAGEIDHLLILDGNPVFDSPGDIDFESALAQVATSVHLGLFDQETAQACTWHLPMAHGLESWGDTWDADGRLCAVQPLIEPLFAGRTSAELLSFFSDETPAKAYDLVRETLRELAVLPELGFDKAWRRYLHDGFTELGQAEVVAEEPLDESFWGDLSEEPSASSLELDLRPDARVHDGRYANNAWLQELPDAMSKLTWGHAALVGPSLAEEKGLEHEDVIRLETSVGSIELPVYVLPGMAGHLVSVALGYGRSQAGRVGNGVGADAYRLQSWGSRWSADLVSLEKTGRSETLASTQDHWAIDNRGKAERERRIESIVREGTLEDYEHHPEFAQHLGVHHPPLTSLWEERQGEGHQWGMAIDLNNCIACNACVVACQSENNIPVVGKKEVANGREMHWIRIDRYFHGDPDSAGMAHQPMACAHCELAPCEQVCPVGATMHSEEGLNVMAYNRCVGTRYCSNNCPYKVRRFNFFAYNNDISDLRMLGINPEVSLRARGVMEKCTYCVQRIEHARIDARNTGKDLADGDIQTACQQTCPSEAIVFGDVADPESRVARLHEDDRAYALLGELNIKPRTVYLARIRNPHPDLVEAYGAASDGDGHGVAQDQQTEGHHG